MTKEMKLMELAKFVNEMKVDDVIDFASGDEETVEWSGGWCGVKRIDAFDNDNPMYIVSHYGGEAEAVLYHISEYDPRIGDFCESHLNNIECCARMIADYLETHYYGVDDVITVEVYK